MPWHITPNHSSCPTSKPFAVVQDSNGKVVGCHPSKAAAAKQLAALNINVKSEPPMTDRHAVLHQEAARLRAGVLTQVPPAVPIDPLRDGIKFGTEFRADTVEREGRQFYVLEGYASTVERPYEMWDQFGPYHEVMSRSAFDATLAADPLVVFRFNHAGIPMASTRNKRLELWADDAGLGDRAYLNPQRDDVQLLMHAVKDGDVNEQSFMFRIEDGVWSDDFTEYRVNQVNIDRGDVGAVTFGANPTTSVAARSGELLAAIPDLPPLVAREAYTLLAARYALPDPPETPTAEPPEEPHGRSLRLRLAQLEIDRTHS